MKTKDIEAIIKDNPSAIFSGQRYGTFTIEGFDYISKNRYSTPIKVAITRAINVFTNEDGECYVQVGHKSQRTLTQISHHVCDSAPEMLASHIAAKAKNAEVAAQRAQQMSMTTDAMNELVAALNNHGIPTPLDITKVYGQTRIAINLTADQAAALVQILNQK